MNFIGVDLHKKTITICVMNEARAVIFRKTISCANPALIRKAFAEWTPYQVVVEATASYEWFLQLVEADADRVVLAHPRKLRIIAESTRKSDKIDATVLATFLALDMIPESHRPSPRVRQHRALVRHRHHVQGRITSVKTKIRRILSDYNADRKDLFSQTGQEYMSTVKLLPADRFILDDLTEQMEQFCESLKKVEKQLAEFAKAAPIAERENREVLSTIPAVGTVTIDVVLSELGDPRRFGSQKKAVSYAGLDPGQRESAGKAKQLGVTKEGSPLLRWALVEAAWRLVFKTARWKAIYEKLEKRCGVKKAIVAVARRLLCTMMSMLGSGQQYRYAL